MKLVAEGLGCMRGGRQVFSGIGFSVAAGGLLVLRGPNGAGKSSLLRLIAGLVRRNAGTLSLVDAAEGVPICEQAHYVGHLDALKPVMTVAENLAFWADMLGGSRASIRESLDTVGLGALAAFPAGVLSAGQRRRLALSRLVAIHRPLWLLDEPTTSIDAEARGKLYDLVRRHLAGGGIALIATHDEIPLDAQTLTLGTRA